jgi:hypothetical protein
MYLGGGNDVRTLVVGGGNVMRNVMERLRVNPLRITWMSFDFLMNIIHTSKLNIGRAMKVACQMKATSQMQSHVQ